MSVWDRYEARAKARGETRREHALRRTKSNLTKHVPDSLSYKMVEINGISQGLAIIDTSTSADEKKIHTLPNESFVCGSLVEWANNMWLIVEVDAHAEVYTSGEMLRCNYLLKWVNLDGDVVERWCVVSDTTQNSSTVFVGDQIDIGEARITVTIGKDEETSKISRDWRFLIDDPDSEGILAYEVVKPSKLYNIHNGSGVYRFLLNETPLTDNDNRDLMIADYYNWSPKTEPLPEDTSNKLSPDEVKEQLAEKTSDNKTEGKKVWL